MHAPAAASQFDRMFQVQHLVVDDVLDSKSRHSRTVENPAYDDGVVRGIVVPQAVARMLAAPRHLRTRQQRVKQFCIQIVKDALEIVGIPLSRSDSFPPAYLS